MRRPHAKIKRHKKSSKRPRKERHQHIRIEENPLTGNFPLREIEHRRRPFFAPPLSIRGAYYCARELSGLFGKGKDEGVFWWHGGGGEGKRERLILPITLCVQTAPRAEGRGRGREKRKVANFLEKKNCRELSSDVRRVGQKRKGGGGNLLPPGV